MTKIIERSSTQVVLRGIHPTSPYHCSYIAHDEEDWNAIKRTQSFFATLTWPVYARLVKNMTTGAGFPVVHLGNRVYALSHFINSLLTEEAVALDNDLPSQQSLPPILPKKHMKYLLSIGIDHYNKGVFGPGIDLEQCAFDADRIEQAVDAYETTKLRNADATKAEIFRQIDHLAAVTVPGDVAIIYQSSHGTYYDVSSLQRKTGRVAHDDVMWDDEWIQKMKAFKKGVVVLCISDCCFSESNSRLLGNHIQNRKERILPIQKVPRNKQPLKAWIAKTTGLKCTLVELSACSFMQTAKEIGPGNGVEQGGVFTTALVEAIKNKKPLSDIIKTTKWFTLQFDQTPKIAYVNRTVAMPFDKLKSITL